MGEELTGAPEADSGNQGQAVDSGTDQGPIRLGIDLTTTVEGRALQSVYDSQVAAERRARKEAERRAEQAITQMNAMLSAVNEFKDENPALANSIVHNAAIAERDEELKQLKQREAEREQREAEAEAQREQYNEAVQWWSQSASAAGVDPSDPEFQAALNRTLADGNTQHAFGAIAQIVARKHSNTQADEEPDYVSPPSGGRPRENLKQADKEALHAELNELYREPTRNRAKIAALKAKLGLG